MTLCSNNERGAVRKNRAQLLRQTAESRFSKQGPLCFKSSEIILLDEERHAAASDDFGGGKKA